MRTRILLPATILAVSIVWFWVGFDLAQTRAYNQGWMQGFEDGREHTVRRFHAHGYSFFDDDETLHKHPGQPKLP